MTGADVARTSSAIETLTPSLRLSAAADGNATWPVAATDQAQRRAAVSVFVADANARLDKVAALRAAIVAGTYDVPAGAVADKLIDSLMR